MADLKSFEVADGDSFGDILSVDRIGSGRKLKIGVVSGGFFEYWPMYPHLRETIVSDTQIVLNRLSGKYDVVYSGLVESIDSADEAGRRLRDAQIDLLLLTERTYVPDVYIHQMLSHLPSVPLLIFVSQFRDVFDFKDDYEGVLRNSGLMSLVQLVAGFRKMDIYPHFEVVVGSIHDDQAYVSSTPSSRSSPSTSSCVP